jgi:hypothetical protein
MSIRRRGSRERREYALCLEVESVGHARAKAKSPQANGICQRFDKTRKDGFHAAVLRREARRETLSREDADADIHGFDAVSRRKTDWLR